MRGISDYLRSSVAELVETAKRIDRRFGRRRQASNHSLPPPNFDHTSARDRFAAIKRTAESIEGMLSDFSMNVMDTLLSFQASQGVSGALIEFGVLHGRSASIIAASAQAQERLILVDKWDNLDRKAISQICPHMEFVLTDSESFKSIVPDFDSLRGKTRFLHVDSSHTYRTTLAELALAEELVHEKGVIALDDFTNLNYSQILAAIFKYLASNRTALTVFLVTDEKAYLCRKSAFEFYGDFALRNLLNGLAARVEGRYALARTDADPEYRAFHVRHALPGETDALYGYRLYEKFYREP
jgi:cephalosporin hydroxylase